ncbi:hypothetical protein LRR81_09540 [Metabacillus sp. GX 13764]|uniref:stalk domain-containing protein n=1 Tax=Metabacillus kandeliae TaxID=2900151 RepID=UPI001E4A8185|nr:stalk domain-containing protein [Metabacillus kandeliae]MCD7034480.1 hypothetical protein [Metabacillus kandeliae]
MKREITSLVIASAVITGSAFSPVMIKASAASVQQKQTVGQETALLNGKPMTVHTTVWNKQKLYSVNDLAKALSAKVQYDKKLKATVISIGTGKSKQSVTVKSGTNEVAVNGKKVKLQAPPRLVGKTIFMDAKTFVQAFGGGILTDKNLLISQMGSFKMAAAKINVDSSAKAIKSLKMNGKYYYSVQETAAALGAKVSVKGITITLTKEGNTSVINLSHNIMEVNGKSVNLHSYPVMVKGTVYADLLDIVNAIDADMIKGENGYELRKIKLLGGDSFAPIWINSNTLLVTNDNGMDEVTYMLDAKTKKTVKIFNGTEFTVSPDRKQAIYSDPNGFAHLVNLSTGEDKQLSAEEDSIKTEYVWAADGSKVYMFQNDKADQIGMLDLTTGTATKVFADSLAYKSDLKLSADGKKLLYVVGKEGKTTNTTDGTDVDNIDMTGTEPQVYVIDLTAKEIKPEAVTTGTENKVSPVFLQDGSIIYISSNPDSETELPVLKKINADKSETALVSNKDIISLQQNEEGKLFILTAEAAGSAVYEVDTASKKLTQLMKTPAELTSINVSKEGIAATTAGLAGDKVVLYVNGKLADLTK